MHKGFVVRNLINGLLSVMMNGKMNVGYGDDATLDQDLINPFTHRLELSTTYDKIKVRRF